MKSLYDRMVEWWNDGNVEWLNIEYWILHIAYWIKWWNGNDDDDDDDDDEEDNDDDEGDDVIGMALCQFWLCLVVIGFKFLDHYQLLTYSISFQWWNWMRVAE